MKIRTDFVTNSSSSSYCVQIVITDNQKNKHVLIVDGEKVAQYGGENCRPNITCCADRILEVKSIEQLKELLIEHKEDISKKKLQEYFAKLEEAVTSIEDIDSITLKRFWQPWGEGSGCTVMNDDTLQQLAQEVCIAKKGEQEAVEQFVHYLDTASVITEGGWGDGFPTDFCQAKSAQPRYRWRMYEDNIQKLAKMIVENNIKDDFTEECTEIDMRNHSITQTAEFIIDGNKSSLKVDYGRTVSYYVRMLQEEFPNYEIATGEMILDDIQLTSEMKKYHLLVLIQGNPVLMIAVASKSVQKQKVFKEVKKLCSEIGLPYIKFNAEDENPVKKVVSKLKNFI